MTGRTARGQQGHGQRDRGKVGVRGGGRALSTADLQCTCSYSDTTESRAGKDSNEGKRRQDALIHARPFPGTEASLRWVFGVCSTRYHLKARSHAGGRAARGRSVLRAPARGPSEAVSAALAPQHVLPGIGQSLGLLLGPCLPAGAPIPGLADCPHMVGGWR